MHASARPRRILTTKSEAKLLHGICSNKMPPLFGEVDHCQLLSHFPGNDLNSSSNSPDNEVHRQILGHRETLQRHILRYLCNQVAEVEDRRQPVVLVGSQVRIVNDAENGRVSELHKRHPFNQPSSFFQIHVYQIVTHSLFIHIHQVIAKTNEGYHPANTFLADPLCLLGRGRLDLDLRQEFVTLVGVAVEQLGHSRC